MSERQLRRRCRQLLHELDIQPPLDVTELCQRLADKRGKPIRLIAHPIPVPGPFGVWISTLKADYILYQQETTTAHQNHIILHEIGHMIADHGSDERDDELLRSLYPDLHPDTVRHALRRTSYDTAQECEAELVATIILQWASVLDVVAPRVSTAVAPARIESALGDRLGWL